MQGIAVLSFQINIRKCLCIIIKVLFLSVLMINYYLHFLVIDLVRIWGDDVDLARSPPASHGCDQSYYYCHLLLQKQKKNGTEPRSSEMQ